MSLDRTPALAVALSLALSGCGSVAAKPAVEGTTPQKRSALDPGKKKPRPRQLVAPPPAYGNKIVTAPHPARQEG